MFLAIATQKRNKRALCQHGIGQTLCTKRAQHTAWPQLHIAPGAELAERDHRSLEVNRPARLLDPIGWLCHLRFGRKLSACARHDADAGLVKRELRNGLSKRGQHRIHARRMKRVAYCKLLALASAFLKLLRNRQHRFLFPRDHGVLRTIHRRNVHHLFLSHKQRPYLRFCCLQVHHRSFCGQRLHEPSTRHHQPTRIAKRKDAGNVGSGNLSHRVPEQEIGPNPESFDAAVQRHLQGKQRWLGILRLFDEQRVRRSGIGRHHRSQRLWKQRIDDCQRRIERLAKRRKRIRQAVSHHRSLTALSSKQQRQLAGCAGNRGVTVRAAPSFR